MPRKKVYVVTGGNRGLGLGLIKTLLARPFTTVVASVRNAQGVASLKAESFTSGDNSILHIIELDFTTAIPPEKIRAVLEEAVDSSVEHVDVLINNAAYVPPFSPAVETSAKDLRNAFETNTIAPLLVFQAFWPLLQKATSTPKVIMITSSVGGNAIQETMPVGAYGPSKAALNWVTRALHLQHDNIVAVALHPGWVKTRAGEFCAKEWNYPADPPVTIEESVGGMLEVIDGATREKFSGKCVTQTGEVLPW